MFASLNEQTKIDDATAESSPQRLTKWVVVAFVTVAVRFMARFRPFPNRRIGLVWKPEHPNLLHFRCLGIQHLWQFHLMSAKNG